MTARGKILVFGGTTEGTLLAERLSEDGYPVTLSVATEYAEGLQPRKRAYALVTRRLDTAEMTRLLTELACDFVVDATHPYAEEATRNIREACEKAGVECLRLRRPESERFPGVVYVDRVPDAVDFLKRETGNVFLAIGSKELAALTRLDDFASRCFVRILPMEESLRKTLALGFRNSSIICMQGPFDEETNRAMLAATRSRILVTKDSGEPGGFASKISAATSCGCRVVVVKRPVEENALSFEELCGRFGVSRGMETKEDVTPEDAAEKRFFPLFFDMKDRRVLIVGGGRVTRRRLEPLLRFGAKICLISPRVVADIHDAVAGGDVELLERKYSPNDVARFSPFLVMAATDDRKTNAAVAEEARLVGVPCIVADNRAECDCVFPAIAESETMLAALVSKDGDHKNVRTTAERVRLLLNDNIKNEQSCHESHPDRGRPR